MGFKVLTCREEMGDPLNMCSVNRDVSPNYPLFRMAGKKIRLLLEGGRIGSCVQKTVCGRSEYDI